MSITDLNTIKLALLCVVLMPGCIIADGGTDDDDGGATEGESASASASASASNSGPSSDSDPSDSDASDSDPSDSDASDSDPSDSDASDSDPSDSGSSSGGGDTDTGADSSSDSGSDSGADGPLEEGSWTYDETGASVDCGAAPTPTNGFGSFAVEASTAAGFTIVPTDGTDPFDCDLDSGAYVCPERLVDTAGQAGTDVSLNAFVTVEGDTLSSSSITGTQFGRLDCEGSECGNAELLLGTSFPCTFEIDFSATKN